MTNRARKSEAQQDIDDEMTARLADGIAALADTEEWKRYLDVQATFPRYSFGNVMAIVLQMPDASLVMPLGDAKDPKDGTWSALGRQLRNGETPLWIRKPWFKTISAEDSRDGEEHCLRRFIWVPVYDASQTEGDPIPSVGVKLLQGADDDDVLGRVVAFISSKGYRVEFVPNIPGSEANGDCSSSGLIRVCTEGRDPRQQAKTAVHEAVHMLLHMSGGAAMMERGKKELEAESGAYVVLKHLGIDSDDYSFGYVLGWAGFSAEGARKAISKSGKRIHDAAAEILRFLGADIPAYAEPERVAA
jgi:hypothetical protein